MLQFGKVTDPVVVSVEVAGIRADDELACLIQAVAISIDTVARSQRDPRHVEVLAGARCGKIAYTHLERIDVQDPLPVGCVGCQEDPLGAQRPAFFKFVCTTQNKAIIKILYGKREPACGVDRRRGSAEVTQLHLVNHQCVDNRAAVTINPQRELAIDDYHTVNSRNELARLGAGIAPQFVFDEHLHLTVA